jgi:RNA polymerase sigma factor (TIGR02999 family)
MATDAPVTELLVDWQAGNEAARDKLFSVFYEEIREVARQQRHRWRGNQTMDTVALVHGLYEKLAKRSRIEASDRTHFQRLASQAIRHILVDYAKKKSRQKRASDQEKVAIEDVQHALPIEAQADELIDLDDALTKLEKIDERMAQVVEMRFFAGLGWEEIGEVLGISGRTARRDWNKARAFLRRALRNDMRLDDDEQQKDDSDSADDSGGD